MTKKLRITLLLSIVYISLFAQNLYEGASIKEIKLSFPRSDWNKFLDSAKQNHSEARMKGTLQFEGQKFEQVGVRYKGNSSYFGSVKKGIVKLPLNIKLAKGQKINNKYETLKLSNVNRDASFIREALSYEIVRSYMPAPQCNFAKVYVNDKYLGLYNNVEAIDEEFIDNYIPKPVTTTPKGEIAAKSLPSDDKKGENKEKKKDKDKMWLVKCDPEWTAEEPKNCPKGDKASLMYLGEDSTCYMPLYDVDKDGEWRTFIQFVKILNTEPDKIERYLNVDQTLWMLALNTVMVNLDSYNGLFSHNYYLLFGPDGRFTPLIWDLNMSLGGFAFDGKSQAPLSTEQMQLLAPMQHLDNPKRPLIAQLLNIPMYRKVYVAHIKTILNDWFVNEKYLKRGKEIAQLIDSQVNDDKNKHYSYQDFKDNLTKTVGTGADKMIGIEELMKKRTEFLTALPILQKTAPTLEGTPIPSVLNDKSVIKIKAKGATRVWFLVRDNPSKAFRYMPFADDGQHGDDIANDGTWGVVFEKKAAMQYYIIAENDDAVTLSPSNASKVFYTLD
jgi:hypothetical protein